MCSPIMSPSPQDERNAPSLSGQTPADGPAVPRVLIAVMPGLVISMMDQTIVSTALPSIVADIGGFENMTLVVVAYLAASAISAPVYGRLGDAIGRRNMLAASLAMTITGSLLCFLASNFTMLVCARAIQGIGSGGVITLSYALVAQWATLEQRARYQGYLATIAMAASAMGPPVGALVAAWAGWRWIFAINIPLGLLAVWLILRLPPRLKPREEARFDLAGVALFGSLTLTLIAFIEVTKIPGVGTLAAVIPGCLGVLLTGILIAQQRRSPDPLFPPLLFRLPSVLLSNALALAHGALYVSLLTFAPVFFSMARGVSTEELGLYMLPITFGTGIGSLLTSRLVARTGRTTIFPVIGLLGIAALLAALATGAPQLANWAISAIFTAIYVFMGTTMAVVQLIVQSEVGPSRLGIGTATITVARSFGASVGTAVAGVILTWALAGTDVSRTSSDLIETGFRTVFAVIAVFALASAVVAAAIPRRRL